MSDFAYNGDLIAGSLMVRESRVVASLLLDAVDEFAWNEAILHTNAL